MCVCVLIFAVKFSPWSSKALLCSGVHVWGREMNSHSQGCAAVTPNCTSHLQKHCRSSRTKGSNIGNGNGLRGVNTVSINASVSINF